MKRFAFPVAAGSVEQIATENEKASLSARGAGCAKRNARRAIKDAFVFDGYRRTRRWMPRSGSQ
jgi:hypothetical protein